jgi:hypothetical protein
MRRCPENLEGRPHRQAERARLYGLRFGRCLPGVVEPSLLGCASPPCRFARKIWKADRTAQPSVLGATGCASGGACRVL